MSGKPADQRIVIVTDGKPGHEKRSLAVARALGSATPGRILLKSAARDIGTSEHGFRSQLHKSRTISRERAQGLILEYSTAAADQLQSLREFGDASWAIATGTPSCAVAHLLATATGVRTMVGGLRPAENLERLFDVCVFPFYHLALGQRRANLVSTMLPPAHHEAIIDGNRESRQTQWLLALGGPAGECEWELAYVEAQIDGLIQAALESNVRLQITPSRRTPATLLDLLCGRAALSNAVCIAKSDERFENLLECASKCFITEDSESMLAEAINAGHHPGVLATHSDCEDLSITVRRWLEDLRLRAGRRNIGYALRFVERRGLSTYLRDPLAIRSFCTVRHVRKRPNAFYDELCDQLARHLRTRFPTEEMSMVSSSGGWR